MSVKFDDFLKEQLQDPEIKKEYDDLQPERAIIQALIDARLQTGMTQKELSEKPGLPRAISASWNAAIPTPPSVRCSAWPPAWE